MKRNIILCLVMMVCCQMVNAGQGSCFIKDGDRVGFFGDSITAHKIYGELVEKVFRHCYPDADVTFVNNGQGGRKLSATKLDSVIKGDPNVITIMIGMNDAIISKWVDGDPVVPKVEQYRKQLTELVEKLKAKDKVVVVMSPTLTEEAVTECCFRLEGTENLLKKMGAVCEEVAKKEKVYFIPVQSEFESYGLTLPRFSSLRPDGVHPCARGHYQIARSIWTHMNFGAPMDGKREIVNLPKVLDVELTPTTKIIPNNNFSVSFNMETELSGELELSWSSNEHSDMETMNLGETNVFDLFMPKNFEPKETGTSSLVVLECEQNEVRKFIILDFFSKAVVHGKNGLVEENIKDGDEVVATYRFKKEGRSINFEISVFKDDIVHIDSIWPWGKGDYINMLLDLRPETDFSGLGHDGDVFQFWFAPQELSCFASGFLPWTGKNFLKLSTAYGQKNSDGYTVGVLLGGSININEKKDYSDIKLISFDLSLGYVEGDVKKSFAIAKSDRQSFLYPGVFTVVDFYNEISEDSIVTVSVFE